MNKSKAVAVGSLSKRDTVTGIIIMASMFFIFGFISWINAILIPYFRIAFELTHTKSYLVVFAFYISYFIFSVPASYLIKRVGFKKGIMIGFWMMSLGAFLFIPSAMAMTYGLFLFGLFSIGAGLSLLQTAALPYITILGPKESAAQRLSIMGICNKSAGILAPLLFAAVIFKATDSATFSQLSQLNEAEKSVVLHELVQRVIVPYIGVGTVLFILGILIRFSPLPEIDTEQESEDVAKANSDKTKIIQFPHLVLGAFAFFLHIGAQIISIDTIISYANSMDIGLIEAKVFPSYALAVFLLGYIIAFLFIPKYFSQLRAFQVTAILGAILTLLVVFGRGQVSFLGHSADISIWFLVLMGLSNSIADITILPLALDGLGKFTKIGASLIAMGLVGNAVLPLVYGSIADLSDTRQAYWVLMPCYLYLIFYAFHGYRLRKWTLSK